MKRRDFIKVISGAAAWPIVANAQQQGRIPVVGVLWHAGSAQEEQPYFDALGRGFTDLGYVEGKTIRFEHRFPNEIPDRFREMAADLVARKVDVIVTIGNAAIGFAKNATTTIPIVFLFVADPVGAKVVDSLARPGGNITGQAQLGADLMAKRFELLRDVVPQLSRVALLFNPGEPSGETYLKEAKSAADTLHMAVLPFELRGLNEVDEVFGKMVAAGVQAVSFGPGGVMYQCRAAVQKLAIAHGMPGCGWSRETALLMSYGADQAKMAQHQAVFVDKILHGIRPLDIPVEQPTQLQLVINQKVARALGVKVPESLLLRADEVIE